MLATELASWQSIQVTHHITGNKKGVDEVLKYIERTGRLKAQVW